MKPLPQSLHHFQRLSELEHSPQNQDVLAWPNLVGRLVEVTGGPRTLRLGWLTQLTQEVQALGDVVVWLQTLESTPFPPDLQRAGVHLETLVVVKLPDFAAQLRAADVLLRSGAFGLCAIDATAAQQRSLDATRTLDNALGRLLGLCQKHGSALVFLTPAKKMEHTEQNFDGFLQSSLISLRMSIARDRGDLQRVQVDIQKDKRHGRRQIQAEMGQEPTGFYSGQHGKAHAT